MTGGVYSACGEMNEISAAIGAPQPSQVMVTGCRGRSAPTVGLGHEEPHLDVPGRQQAHDRAAGGHRLARAKIRVVDERGRRGDAGLLVEPHLRLREVRLRRLDVGGGRLDLGLAPQALQSDPHLRLHLGDVRRIAIVGGFHLVEPCLRHELVLEQPLGLVELDPRQPQRGRAHCRPARG